MARIYIDPLDIAVPSYAQLERERPANQREILPNTGRKLIVHYVKSIIRTQASVDSVRRVGSDPVVLALLDYVDTLEERSSSDDEMEHDGSDESESDKTPTTDESERIRRDDRHNVETRGVETYESSSGESTVDSAYSTDDGPGVGKKYKRTSLKNTFAAMEAAARTQIEGLWYRYQLDVPTTDGAFMDQQCIELALQHVSLGNWEKRKEKGLPRGGMFDCGGACTSRALPVPHKCMR